MKPWLERMWSYHFLSLMEPWLELLFFELNNLPSLSLRKPWLERMWSYHFLRLMKPWWSYCSLNWITYHPWAWWCPGLSWCGAPSFWAWQSHGWSLMFFELNNLPSLSLIKPWLGLMWNTQFLSLILEGEMGGNVNTCVCAVVSRR